MAVYLGTVFMDFSGSIVDGVVTPLIVELMGGNMRTLDKQETKVLGINIHTGRIAVAGIKLLFGLLFAYHITEIIVGIDGKN